MVEDGELAALVPEVGLRLVQPLQHQHLVKDGQRRGEHLIKYRAATTLTEVAKEVSCTWQTCGSGVVEVDDDGDGGDSECGDDGNDNGDGGCDGDHMQGDDGSRYLLVKWELVEIHGAVDVEVDAGGVSADLKTV